MTNKYYQIPFSKGKRIPKLNVGLSERMGKSHLWRAIKAGHATMVYEKLALERKELEGSKAVSYRDGMLKIKAGSSAQRMELMLRKEEIKEIMRSRGVAVGEVKVII